MKRYIKIITVVISIVMLLSLFACDNGTEKADKGKTEESTTQAVTTETEAETTEQADTETTTVLETTTETEVATQTESVTTEETTTESDTAEESSDETVTSDDAPESTETETATSLILGDEVEYAAGFTVSKVFNNDMVIQRGEYIRVWGWADESENGKKISAEFLGARADAIIENGEWEITICTVFEANKNLGNSLTVYTDTTTVSFDNVLVGDVYMVIGQSNVQYSINEYLNYNPNPKWTLDDLNEDALIRIIYNSNTDNAGYPTRGTTEVCKDLVSGNKWVIPSKTNITKYTALGYFFANEIIERTDNEIPVGIIQMSASGRPLCTFMPNELADKYGSDFLDSDGIYKGNVHKDNAIARYMYNHYMYAYERMPLAGIVWNQGEPESTPDLSTVYVERFTALMTYMREKHNMVNKEFPVIVVEFPTTYSKPEGYEGSWPQYLDTGRIRATMGMIPESLSNSYIAVCSDLWADETHYNNIHPYCKYSQAERVADLAEVAIYGGKTLDEATGPILESVEISADRKTAILKFTNVGEGLATADGGTTVYGFASLVKNNSIDPKGTLTAEITAPDTITITSTRAMSGIAYNCITGNFYGDEINLCDSYGNPARAFWYFKTE